MAGDAIASRFRKSYRLILKDIFHPELQNSRIVSGSNLQERLSRQAAWIARGVVGTGIAACRVGEILPGSIRGCRTGGAAEVSELGVVEDIECLSSKFKRHAFKYHE